MATDISSLVLGDKAHIWHPFTQMQTAKEVIGIVKAKGAYLYDEAGYAYLDGISSWWVNLHGHAHPYIAQKIGAQAITLEHTIFADFTHPPAVELGKRLTPLLPGQMQKLFFSDNGSTSVEVALKMALQYWYNGHPKTKRTKILCFKGSYHGDTFGAMSVSDKSAFNKPFWSYLFDVTAITPPLVGQEEQSFAELKRALAEDTVACFIFEPLILGVGGMVIYPAKGLDALLRLCQQHNIITIADEVMTGFGRTGTLFACDQLQEKPDIVCLSKGLTGGFLPMGVTATTQQIYDRFLSDDKKQAFLHGHSYTANPLACSSALASLDLLQKPSSLLRRKKIESSHRAFCDKWQNHPKLMRCESLGTILALSYKANSPDYFASIRDELYEFFLKRGILLRPLGNVLYVLPPYCITQAELALIYDTIELHLRDH